MSDIVEELRRASARGMEHHAGPVRAYMDAGMLADAAAEIERLRRENKTLRVRADQAERLAIGLENIAWATPERTAYSPEELHNIMRATAESVLSAIRTGGET